VTDRPTLESPNLDRRTLAALLEASTLINGSLELDEVLQRIAESAAEVIVCFQNLLT